MVLHCGWLFGRFEVKNGSHVYISKSVNKKSVNKIILKVISKRDYITVRYNSKQKCKNVNKSKRRFEKIKEP